MAAIVAAHAALVAVAWQPPASPRPASPQRMSMRLMAIKPTGQVVAAVNQLAAAAAKPVAEKPVATKPANETAHEARAARATQASPAPKPIIHVPPEPRVASAEPVVAVTAPIQGVAFAPPVIGFGPPPARREAARAVFLPPPPQLPPPQGQLQAARAQIADALERELAAWAAPLTSRGACALAAEPQPHLACDNDALSAAIAPREPALAGLLRAWRSMEPRTQGLTIAVVDGRYQASWN